MTFIVTYAMVPASKKLATVLGAIDYPSNRRINTEPVPRCGGIALYLGMTAGALTVFLGTHFFGWELYDLYRLKDINYPLVYVGISAMLAVGLVDDITQLHPLPKFGGQIVAAAIVVAAGVSIGSVRIPLDTDYVNLSWLDAPLTGRTPQRQDPPPPRGRPTGGVGGAPPPPGRY